MWVLRKSEYNFNVKPRNQKKRNDSLRVKLTIRLKEKKVLMSAIRQHFWSSEEEHRADALALGADEGRDKLR